MGDTSGSVKKNTGAGLRGQSAGETAICTVGAEGNSLRYRGYDVVELAEHSTFCEVAHLILKGELPTQSQLDDFVQYLASRYPVLKIMKAVLTPQFRLLGAMGAD